MGGLRRARSVCVSLSAFSFVMKSYIHVASCRTPEGEKAKHLPSTLAINNIGSGRWAITVHYAAIDCQQGTTGSAVPLLVVVVVVMLVSERKSRISVFIPQ